MVNAEIEAIDVIDEDGNLRKQSTIGKKKFNMDARKGIDYLVEQGLLTNTADAIAEFLYKGEGLSKAAIGDYLGEKRPLNMEVLDRFVNLHTFEGFALVQVVKSVCRAY